MATSIPDFTKGLVRKPPVDFSKGLVAKPKEDAKPSSAGAKKEARPKELTHPLGKVTGIDEESGLPIVRRQKAEEAIGEKDKETGRDVLHTPNSPDAIQEKATSEHPDIKQELQQIVSGVKGATLDAARDEKDEDRLEEKVSEDGQPPKTIPDFSAFRIAVDTPAARDEVVKAIRENFTVVREKDEFEKGAEDTGFHAHMLQVQQSGSDVSHEIQVLPKHVADIAEDTHDLYEKARNGDGAAAADLKGKNDAAYGQFKAANEVTPELNSDKKGGRDKSPEPKDRGEAEPTSASESLKKGDTVTLKDGRKATIAYAPPKGAGIAVYRLKTEDGKTIALRAKEVENTAKPAPDDKKGIILVDFDKTLVSAGGKPEAAMVDRIKQDLDAGKTVKIFTAKVANDNSGENRRFVQRWTKLHFGRELPVTNKKMHDTAEILDDKAFHVAPNTGRVEA